MVVTRAIGLRSPGELRREHLEVIVEVGRRMKASELYPYPPLALRVLEETDTEAFLRWAS